MPKTKTILQVVPSLKSGGVESETIEIAQSIVSNGMNSLVISSGGQLVKDLEKGGTTHIQFDVATKNPIKIIKNINKIAKIIRENNVDLIHVRSRAPAWSVYYAAKKTKIPMLVTFHGAYGTKPKIKKWYNRIMLKGEKVIAISEFIKDHILSNYDIDESKIVVIPRGADTEKFNPANVKPEDVDALKKEWNLPADKPLILMPTRITPIKGIEVLMKAVIDNPTVFCAVVGSDHGRENYKKHLVDLTKKLKIDDRFKFFPPIKNIEVAYAMADVVMAVSVHPEAFGRTMIEAQAMGKIPIASNHGGAAEIIKDEENGYLVGIGNAKETKEAIEKFFALSEKEHLEMVESAIHNVISKYSKDQMSEGTLHLYEDLTS